ncbi:MAG: nicotinate phosphoribosyltransferase, partial [Clostridia bacterium]|nr:nicotinate phosphoribosyltransferase [Clostridia bacterium]
MNNKENSMDLYIDFYEFTMAQVLFDNNKHEEIAYFDYFFRKVPDEGGFAIMAGLQQQIEFIVNQRFSPEDIDYLRAQGMSEGFLEYLKDYKFTGDIWAIPEGTPVFPNEPLVTIRGTMLE